MDETKIIIAGIIGSAAVLSVVVYLFGRLKIEQQKTLQRLLEKDDSSRTEWARALGPGRRGDNDFRRGVLLIVIGTSLGTGLFFVGGSAWTFSLLPVTIGLVYLMFWKVNASQRT